MFKILLFFFLIQIKQKFKQHLNLPSFYPFCNLYCPLVNHIVQTEHIQIDFRKIKSPE